MGSSRRNQIWAGSEGTIWWSVWWFLLGHSSITSVTVGALGYIHEPTTKLNVLFLWELTPCSRKAKWIKFLVVSCVVHQNDISFCSKTSVHISVAAALSLNFLNAIYPAIPSRFQWHSEDLRMYHIHSLTHWTMEWQGINDENASIRSPKITDSMDDSMLPPMIWLTIK